MASGQPRTVVVTFRIFSVRQEKKSEAGGLTEPQKKVLQLIQKGCSQRVAAERIGVNERTITRWKRHNSSFRQAVDEARSGPRK